MWSDEPILDADTMARLLRLGGPGFVEELMRLFDDHGAQRVQAIAVAVDVGDMNGVRRGAHSLVSTAGNLGARRLQALASALERAAASLDAATVTSLAPALAPAFDAAREALVRSHAESTP